ncbi:MAG: tRNA uridine-5-carboxymethylaminomethyl(34) synthesis GTPase MnmE [Actinobacteria bacterium]|nr:tRNA uridine-5-carboxymethylaminomethyl(34) synthesis GTPase MnmE [Actinomycetota bacterium]
MEETIVAIGTRPGESAIGIVRISGKEAINIADKIFRPKKNLNIRKTGSYRMLYGHVIDSNEKIIDEVIVSLMRKPGSYTREDVVEINCHGGIAATTKVLELCTLNGSRLAEPGEFTKRAFLNGRIDLSQAESVIDMVRSKTEQCMKIAAANIAGGIKEKIYELKKMMMEIMVQLETAVDFIEEDLETTKYGILCKNAEKILSEISKLIKDEERGEILKNGIKIAIVGKTNVGKSSLLNVLSRKDKAIVTDIPGTTRDPVEEILYVEGIPLILIDTAGIRKSRNTIEKIGVERSLLHINEADLIIFVIDGSRKISSVDLEIMKKLKEKKTILCINKNDLVKRIDEGEIEDIQKFINVVHVSALKDQGIDMLEKSIKKAIFGDSGINIEERIIVNTRHKDILKKAKKAIKDSIFAMKMGISEEFPSSDLKIAYDLLGEITGETIKENILDNIFKEFCIGK